MIVDLWDEDPLPTPWSSSPAPRTSRRRAARAEQLEPATPAAPVFPRRVESLTRSSGPVHTATFGGSSD